jgi:hypothetical protein
VNASAPPRDHDQYEALAVAWAIDALEPADQVVFEDHRDGCDACGLTVLAALRIAAELAYGVPDIEPPPRLRRRILAAAGPLPAVQGTSADSSPRDGGNEPADMGGGGPAGFAALDLSGGTNRIHSTDRSDGSGGTDDTDRTHHTDWTDDTDRTHHTDWTDDTDRTQRTDWTRRTDRSDGGDRTDSAERTRGSEPPAGARPPGHRRPGGRRLGGRRLGLRSAPDLGRDKWGASRSGMRRRRIVSVLAAAALVGISAVTTWEITRPAAVTSPTATAERTATLSAPTGEGTVATVVVRAGRADVVTDALPANTETTEFYMWGVPAGGAGTPQVVGTFEVTASGLRSYPVNLIRSLEAYPVLAISEELAGSSPGRPSSVIARGALGR